jgi:hypothetical protein
MQIAVLGIDLGKNNCSLVAPRWVRAYRSGAGRKARLPSGRRLSSALFDFFLRCYLDLLGPPRDDVMFHGAMMGGTPRSRRNHGTWCFPSPEFFFGKWISGVKATLPSSRLA